MTFFVAARALALVLLLALTLAVCPNVAQADSCLDAGAAFVPETALVVLSFASPGSSEALVIESVLGSEQRWQVRSCDDLRLLDRIKHGDKGQLDQLLSRKILLVVFQEGAVIKHHLIPYAYARVSQQSRVPAPQEFEMCRGGAFDHDEACKRYAGPVRAVTAAAAAIYKANLSACPELEDASRGLNEALAELPQIRDSQPKKELRDFIVEQRDRLQKTLAAKACGPRNLNTRLLRDRVGAGGPVLTNSTAGAGS